MFIKKFAVIALFAMGQASGQTGALLDLPDESWSTQLTSGTPGVIEGNGCVLSPDGKSLVVTSVDGTISSLTTSGGAPEWDYAPTLAGVVRSHSHAVFTTENAATPYLIYTVSTNENSAEAKT